MKFNTYRALDYIRTPEQLETYVQERMRLERRPMNRIARIIGYAALILLGMWLAGCGFHAEVVSKPEPKEEIPIAAFGVNQCGGAVVLIVIVDDTHVLRFDMKQTTIFVRKPDGTVSEESGPPTPFSVAFELASKAPITSNATVPCGHPETQT